MVTSPVKVCECCGQVVPPDNPFAGQPVKARIYEYISKNPGKSRNEIIDHVYADDPDGGPEWTSTLSVHIHFMNWRLRKLGLRIAAMPWHGYRILPLTDKDPYRNGVEVTPQLARQIEELYPTIQSHRKLAAHLGTSVGTVQRVLAGKVSL
jgi:hypothetical protein